MEPLKQIDAVFFYLKEKINVGGMYGYTNIINYLDVSPEFELVKKYTLVKEIIQRLIDDGFIREHIVPNSQPTYNLTFEGLLFDGYEKSKAYREAALLNEAAIAENNQRNVQAMTDLTKWLMIFAAISALYYLVELGKWIASVFQDCPSSH